jgi:hypothetical protein
MAQHSIESASWRSEFKNKPYRIQSGTQEAIPMRKLSDEFMCKLKHGFLSGIVQRVKDDKDLDLQIRDNYLNLYYKGNSLLKLSEASHNHYRVDIHQKFLGGSPVPDLTCQETVAFFLGRIPDLKANIIRYGRSSLELEYEQLIIRANNQERRNASEYFIVDRQYATGGQDRFDLTAVFWDRKARRRGQEVFPCFMEVKFALNTDIATVHQQLRRCYEAICEDPPSMAQEAEIIFRQKLDLGIYDQPENRIEAMKTLRFSEDIDRFQFILVLVDYNPYSSLLDLKNLAELPFANQVKVFHTGFAMWETNFIPVASYE